MKKYIRQHYHWIIAALAFFEIIVFGGLSNSVNVYIIPVTESLGVTRGSYSLAVMPYIIACVISNMCSGALLQRLGYKKTVLAGLAATAIAHVLMPFSQNLLFYGAVRILFGFGYGVCFTAGAVKLIKDWFVRHQGLVCGVVSMASGVGGSIMTMILTGLVENLGWKTAMFISAGMVLVTTLTFVFIKNRPEDKGLTPYGQDFAPEKVQKANTRNVWEGLSFGELTHKPVFYFACFCVFVSCACMYVTSQMLIPFLEDSGFAAGEAAAMQSMFLLSIAIIKVFCGALCDRISAKYVAVGCLAGSVIGQLLLCVGGSSWIYYVGVLVFSTGLAMTSVMLPLLALPLFGQRPFLNVGGIFLGMASLGNLAAQPIANTLFDKFGTYVPVYIGAAVIHAIIIGCFFWVYALAKRLEKQITSLNRSSL